MSTAVDRLALAQATIAFAKALNAWVGRAAVAESGASAPRLQLLYELHCNGPRKMADLADALGVTPRAVTALVDGLEAEELVHRSAHPTDRRVTMVELLPAGTATADQGFGAYQASVEDLFAGLDDADAAALIRAFGVLGQRMRTTPAQIAEDEPGL